MLTALMFCLASCGWQDTPTYMKNATRFGTAERSATSWLENAAAVIGPELDQKEESVLMEAVKATVDRVVAQRSLMDLDAIANLNMYGLQDSTGMSYIEIPEEGKPTSYELALQARMERSPEIRKFLEWELQAVQSCLDELPFALRQKVVPAIEQCRLVDYGVGNYVRWIAPDPLMSEAALREFPALIQREIGKVDQRVLQATVEVDRKIIEILPAPAKDKFERRLGFPIKELPAWRGRVLHSTYGTLWLPFEQSAGRPYLARLFLGPYLDGTGKPGPLPYYFLTNVSLRDVGREYGMRRYSPDQIKTAAEESLKNLRLTFDKASVEQLEGRGVSRQEMEFHIEKLQQWINGEPIDTLADWDYLLNKQRDYWKHYAPVSELKQVAGRSPVLSIDDRNAYSGSHWYGLLQFPEQGLGRLMDLSERQQQDLRSIWNEYSPTGQDPFTTEDDYRRMLQEIDSVLTPGQAVLGFQIAVAVTGPFAILIHPASAEEYELTEHDRLKLKSLVQRERTRIRDWRRDLRVDAYRAVLDSLEPEVLNRLVEKLDLSADRIASSLADCARYETAKTYPIMPLPYASFGQYYDHGRIPTEAARPFIVKGIE